MNWRYVELDAAMKWGLTPPGFDAQDDDSKAEEMAFIQAHNTVEAWHYEQSDAAAKRKEK